MGADPLSILKQVVEVGFQIKDALEKAGHNEEDCRRTGELLRTLRAIAEAPKVKDGPFMRDAAAGLEGALRRASELVAKCRGKAFLCRAFQAGDIADRLRGVCIDVLLNLNAVLLANGVQLRADVAYGNSMLDKIFQILVAANPDVHPRKEVEELVQNYRDSTEYSSSRIGNKRETQKTTGIAASQDENKRETKKTDVARPQVQKNNALGDSKAPHASLSGVAESVSGESVNGQNGSSTIINKASSSVSELVDKVQSVAVSASPFQLQQIIYVSEVPGERCSYKLVMSRSTKNMTPCAVTSIDVHPTKKWIVTGHQGGYFSIWDYQEQKCLKEVKVNTEKASWLHGISQYFKETAPPHWVCSTKFIVQEKWLAVGDGHGYIYIYAYTDTDLYKVEKFIAHDKSVDTLCVHPTEPYLLSSSAYDNKIKLWVWDWSRNWKQFREFDVGSVYPKGVLSLKFNPRDSNTFACVTDDERVMVWDINSSSFTTRPKKEILDADYFFTHSQQHLMVTTSTSASLNCEIRDVETGKVVHTLGVSGRKMKRVAGHPTIPILVSTSEDGTVYFWDASTYRLVETVQIPDSKPRDLVLFTDINGLTRLVATFKTTIAIMEVNLPIANTSIETGSGNFG